MTGYTFDSVSLMRGGERFFPTMGEIHYSRVPRGRWADTLRKMRAGGVDVASAYVIWIHHEEVEGEYDWTGVRDLRAFLETARDEGVKILLRIGPWIHGEVRNGGFPDWLLRKDFKPRTNDARYFDAVRKWYAEIFAQARGLVSDPADPSTDGAPIIGVQIENEFGHCGGLYDETGEEHMRTLTGIAREAGFRTHLYTATGWGGARTGGLLPVMGGYCDAPWDPRTVEIEPSGNYVFTHERNDHNIGSDHGLGYGITFDPAKFPYLTAELGGGLQPTAHRRTIALPEDIAAVALTKLGSGCNLLGYYMYAGGTNPDGKLTTLQETRATGYPNDLPAKSYDFRAPVREFGQVSDTLRELKLLSYFARDFGAGLCPMGAKIPAENPLDPADARSLRFSFRTDGGGNSGYLFVNNHVRHRAMAAHTNVAVKTPGGRTLPPISVADGDFFFLPFGVELGGAAVDWAEATPFVVAGGRTFLHARRGDTRKSGFVRFRDAESAAVGASSLAVLSREDALNSWRAHGSLAVTRGGSFVLENGDGSVSVTGRGETAEISLFPRPSEIPGGWTDAGTTNLNRDSSLSPAEAAVLVRGTGAESGAAGFARLPDGADGSARYSLSLSSLRGKVGGNVSDVFVSLDYAGDRAALYDVRGGARRLLLDHFYLGGAHPWEIGLSRFSADELSELELEVLPLKKGADIYIERLPDFGGADSLAELRSAGWESEWTYTLRF